MHSSKAKNQCFFKKNFITLQGLSGPLHLFEKNSNNIDFSLWGKKCGFPKLHFYSDFCLLWTKTLYFCIAENYFSSIKKVYNYTKCIILTLTCNLCIAYFLPNCIIASLCSIFYSFLNWKLVNLDIWNYVKWKIYFNLWFYKQLVHYLLWWWQ